MPTAVGMSASATSAVATATTSMTVAAPTAMAAATSFSPSLAGTIAATRASAASRTFPMSWPFMRPRTQSCGLSVASIFFTLAAAPTSAPAAVVCTVAAAFIAASRFG